MKVKKKEEEKKTAAALKSRHLTGPLVAPAACEATPGSPELGGKFEKLPVTPGGRSVICRLGAVSRPPR